MRKLFFLFLISGYFLNAQDTLIFRNGEKVAVKVNEIGTTDIRYNRADNLNGPKYVVDKNDVRFIKYPNGAIDSFAVVKKPVSNVLPQNVTPYPECSKLAIGKNNKILCNTNPLSERRIYNVIMSLPDSEKKDRLMKVHFEMKNYQKKQYYFGFGGLILLAAAPGFGLLASLFADDITPYFVGIGVGAAGAITGAIVSKEFKMKRMAKRRDIVRIYNE